MARSAVALTRACDSSEHPPDWWRPMLGHVAWWWAATAGRCCRCAAQRGFEGRSPLLVQGLRCRCAAVLGCCRSVGARRVAAGATYARRRTVTAAASPHAHAAVSVERGCARRFMHASVLSSDMSPAHTCRVPDVFHGRFRRVVYVRHARRPLPTRRFAFC